MDVYRVRHKSAAEHCYYTLARSPSEAVERVTLAIEDAEGADAWSVEQDTPGFSVGRGCVLDREGRALKTLEP